jgi:hypothetical protein
MNNVVGVVTVCLYHCEHGVIYMYQPLAMSLYAWEYTYLLRDYQR